MPLISSRVPFVSDIPAQIGSLKIPVMFLFNFLYIWDKTIIALSVCLLILTYVCVPD